MFCECLIFSPLCTHCAEAAKEEEAEDDDDMDGFQTDDEDEEGNGFDKEMGVDAVSGVRCYTFEGHDAPVCSICPHVTQHVDVSMLCCCVINVLTSCT